MQYQLLITANETLKLLRDVEAQSVCSYDDIIQVTIEEWEDASEKDLTRLVPCTPPKLSIVSID